MTTYLVFGWQVIYKYINLTRSVQYEKPFDFSSIIWAVDPSIWPSFCGQLDFIKEKSYSWGSWIFFYDLSKNLKVSELGGSDKFDGIFDYSRVAWFSIFMQLIYLIIKEPAGAIVTVSGQIVIASFGTDFDSLSHAWDFGSCVM